MLDWPRGPQAIWQPRSCSNHPCIARLHDLWLCVSRKGIDTHPARCGGTAATLRWPVFFPLISCLSLVGEHVHALHGRQQELLAERQGLLAWPQAQFEAAHHVEQRNLGGLRLPSPSAQLGAGPPQQSTRGPGPGRQSAGPGSLWARCLRSRAATLRPAPLLLVGQPARRLSLKGSQLSLAGLLSSQRSG